MEKKVGILNCQCVDNYGAVIVSYALWQAIQDGGYDVETIDYRRPLPVDNSPEENLFFRSLHYINSNGLQYTIKKVFSKILHIRSVDGSGSEKIKAERFKKFRERYLRLTAPYKSFSYEDKLGFDIYVVGSDMVWKPYNIYSKNKEADVYFLNFTEKENCRRIAYAASIGTDDKSELERIKERFGQFIQKFDSISVREKTSVSYVQELYKKNQVKCCIDPTLLIDRRYYDMMLAENDLDRTPLQRYIYVYLLGDDPEATKLVDRYSKKMNLPVVYQCGHPGRIKNKCTDAKYDGPIEFISRIKNADFVITDSFHGTAFSVIYRKNFRVLNRGTIGLRMKDFLEKVELTERFVTNLAEHKADITPVDYDKTENILNTWKDESLSYLHKALKGEEPS